MSSAPAGISDADWLATPAAVRAFILVQQQEIQALRQANDELRAWLSSHPGELPPEVLTEPYVTLSRHTAPIIHSPQHRHLASEQTGLIVAA